MVIDQSILSRFVDFLSDRPSAREVLNFKATPNEESRYESLLQIGEDYRTPDEQFELQELQRANHLMSMVKIKALRELGLDNE